MTTGTRFVFKNGSPAPAARVALHFWHDRTKIGTVRVVGPTGGREVERVNDVSILLELDAPIAPGDTIAVMVDHAGNSPSLRRFRFLAPAQLAAVAEGIAPEAMPPMLTSERQGKTLVAESLTAEDEFELRWQKVKQRRSAPVGQALELFYWMDWESHPALKRNAARLPTLDEAKQALEHGVFGRVATLFDLQYGSSPVEPRRLESLVREASGWIAPYVRRIYRRRGRLQVDACGRAFCLFAGDALDIGMGPYSRPDSSMFFLFGELAVQASEARVDTDVWTPLLGGIVASVEIFATLQHHSQERREWNNYTPMPHTNRPVRMKEVDAMLGKYRGLDPVRRFSEVLGSALFGWADRQSSNGPATRLPAGPPLPLDRAGLTGP